MNIAELEKIIHDHELWLSGQGGARADLSDADLMGADLSGAKLSRADLSGADLSGAYLSGADLSGADLSGALLHEADLSRADLSSASLLRADLLRADLSSADLSNAYLSRAGLIFADLSGANLSNADLSGSAGGPKYYSISWRGHGERGRRLHAVEQDGQLIFSCGCFSGTEKELREYIKKDNPNYAASRVRALEFILEIHKEEK